MKAALKGVHTFRNSGQIITRITYRSIIRGAIILGVITGGMVLLQGTAYVASYTTEAARHNFAQTLIDNPSLGILYGDPSHTTTARGYIVYRCLAFVMIASSIWALLIATRLFRGQEDDGRQEMLLSGQTTAARATVRTTVGFLMAWAVAFAICASLVVLTGQSKDIFVSGQTAVFFALAAYTPALLFFCVGAFVSQLAGSRRKATLYGLIPLAILYIVRCLAHILQNNSFQLWTPYGWIERAQPIIHTQWQWLLPVVGLAIAAISAATWISARRDLGDSLIAEADVAQPRYALLNNIWQLTLRLTGSVTTWWLVGTAALAALMTSLAKMAAGTVADSGSLSNALNELTGVSSSQLTLAFMSMATFFVALFLMIIAANTISNIRSEEAKSYLDAILSRPIGRLQWLRDRLVFLGGALLLTYLASSLLIVTLAKHQGITLDGPKLLLQGLNMFGPVSIVLGAGILLYGWKPRFAAVAMYIVLGWSFLVDMIGSVVKLNGVIANSSLLHHIALVPAAKPDWEACFITLAIGILLTSIGMYGFARRDLEVE